MNCVIIYSEGLLEPHRWAEGPGGSRVWANLSMILTKIGGTPSFSLLHFEKSEAEAEAFSLIVRNSGLIGKIVVVECDLEECRKCRVGVA